MDFISDDARLALSFRADRLNLKELCPEGCFETNQGRSQNVRLDHRWEELFLALGKLGKVRVGAPAGPLALAQTWDAPVFLPLPGAEVFLEMNSGAEIRVWLVNSVMAVVDEIYGRHMARLQFIDSGGQCLFRLWLTENSDVEAFRQLVSEHARPGHPLRRRGGAAPAERALGKTSASRAAVRRLWGGLSRTMPTHFFPGLHGVSRRDALAVAGSDLAWPVSSEAVKTALLRASQQRAELRVSMHNVAVELGGEVRPAYLHSGARGHAYFSEAAQLMLMLPEQAWDAWAVRDASAGCEGACVEIYNAEARFCGLIGLSPETPPEAATGWSEALEKGVKW